MGENAFPFYYRPSPLAQKPSNGVLASRDTITLSNAVKYHLSSNTLISTEERGGVRNWRVSETTKTLSGVYKFELVHLHIFITHPFPLLHRD